MHQTFLSHRRHQLLLSTPEESRESRRWSSLKVWTFQAANLPAVTLPSSPRAMDIGVASSPWSSLASSPWSSPQKMWSCSLPRTRLWQIWEQQKPTLCTFNFVLLMRECSKIFLNGHFLPFLRNIF